MTVLPIVERELRVASRRWGTYILRLTASTIAIAIATIVYLTARNLPPAEIGKVMFNCLSGFAFLYALLIGVRVTSDSISSEKRDGTLGLLFLTDLKGVDIILGKLVAFALDSFYALVATLPVLAIPILMGSITPDEIWRMSLCLVVVAFFSVSMGMFVSAISVRERKASIGTFLLIAFFTAGIPLLIVILQAYALLGGEVEKEVFALSPAAAVIAAMSWSSMGNPELMFGWSLAATLAYAITGLCLASVIVPRVWHDSGRERKVPALVASQERQSEKRRMRQDMLDTGPTYWLSSRGHLRGLWLWGFLGFVTICWLWGYYENGAEMLQLVANLVIMYLVHGVFKVFVASEAVRIYAEEDKEGALELLLCTPITVAEVLRGQLISLFRYFRWPALALLLADLFFILVGRSSLGSPSGSDRQLTIVFLLIAVTFVIDCVALSLVGLWHGLIARNSRSALTSAVGRILVLPWVLFGLLSLSLALLSVRIDGDHMVWIWFGLGVLLCGLFGWRAWEQLSQNLRIIAATRFEKPVSGIWRTMGRAFGRWAFKPKPAGG